jgi:hypothetical protein
MGLFSEVFNSCPLLGEEFLGSLQTKDFDCILDRYWISPNGEVFKIDGSFDFESKLWYDLVVRPYLKTVVARLYTIRNDNFFEISALFRLGKLIEVVPQKGVESLQF